MVRRVSNHISMEMQECIDRCTECHQLCTDTAAYCLQQGGRHADFVHMTLLLDCAEICQTSANFMLRSSELHGWVCGVCAEICKQCGESCEEFDSDEQMHRCAEACARCTESCRQMAGMAETRDRK